MKKVILATSVLGLTLGLSGCDFTIVLPSQSVQPGMSSTSPIVESSKESESVIESTIESSKPIVKENFTIYLAGDSTVKTYNENTYIGGWGQYFEKFFDTDYVKVVNMAEGGRSTRSFINEGRLYESNATSTFKVTSIESQIKEGDYLFIQFGHNDDDTKKSSSYSTMYDRMVPLGQADNNGIYPTTPATKVATSSLPQEYINYASDSEEASALTTLAKYGSEYYSYDCGGTYKWYLKQYVEFAQSKGATPVLVTPVARVKFSGDEIIGGAGLHGENFAYVEAVRQLADELDVALIDLFADSKEMLETATPEYANFLMALKPNDLSGNWPSGYDMTYQNTNLGYTGIEGTHYNKYGAYLQAAMVSEQLLNIDTLPLKHYIQNNDYYIEPSNNISKSVQNKLASLIEVLDVVDENKNQLSVQSVISTIDELSQIVVTMDNIEAVKVKINEALELYYSLNIDDRTNVTNYSSISAKETEVKNVILANKKDPIAQYELNASNLELVSSFTDTMVVTTTDACFKLVAGGSEMKIQAAAASVVIGNNDTATEFTQRISMGGSGNASKRNIEFTVSGACSITVVCQSSSSSAVRAMSINAPSGASQTIEAGTSATVSTVELTEAGTYWLASTGSGVYVYYVLVQYYE